MRWFIVILSMLTLGCVRAEDVTLPVEEPAAELLESRKFFTHLDFGFGGFGNTTPLRPTGSFGNRSALFPIPTVQDLTGASARVELGYNLGLSPWTVSASWEHLWGDDKATLIGFDEQQAPYLRELNQFRENLRRDDDSSFSRLPDELTRSVLMRGVPSDAHTLQSRTTAHLVDIAAMYSFKPREGRWFLIPRAILGARYGGFFSEDRATGAYYEQSASNWFSGTGPLVGFRLDAISNRVKDRAIPTAFVDVRGGALFGDSRVRFREVDKLFNGMNPAFREQLETSFKSVPFINLETGFGLQARIVRWTVGYRFQYAWGVGNVGSSERDFSANHIFFRAEIGL